VISCKKRMFGLWCDNRLCGAASLFYHLYMYSPVLFFLFLLLCAQNNVGLNWFVAVRRMSEI